MSFKVPIKDKGKVTAFALVDSEDYGLVVQYNWRLDKEGYAVCTAKTDTGRTTYRMHRLVMHNPVGWEVDHESTDRLDNRKRNLRLCSSGENKANQNIRSDNQSGSKGVSWSKQYEKWVAKISVNKKTIFLGRFKFIQDAIEAYDTASIKYYGKFARNTPKK